MKRVLLLSAFLVGACTASPPPPIDAQPIAAPEIPRPLLPTGARLGPSGFLTVEQAPPSPILPAQPRRPNSERTYYAELAGVSNEEAGQRLVEQERTRPEFERLVRQLRTRERGNYTDAEMIHRPDWAYLIFFKRQPEQTLRKYTRNPRFQARSAPYTEAELRTLSQPWIDRLQSERLVTGYSLNARQGRAQIDMVVGKHEFAALAARRGWGDVPEFMELRFGETPVGPAIAPGLEQLVRIFPQSDRNLGIHHQAGYSGKIVLRDGCFQVVGFDGKVQLAYFPREAGLYRDPQGYLALRTRSEPARHLGRIGEEFSWAGPIPVPEGSPMVRELRADCGNAPLMHVAIPESSAIFNGRYGLPRNPPPPPPTVPQTGN